MNSKAIKANAYFIIELKNDKLVMHAYRDGTMVETLEYKYDSFIYFKEKKHCLLIYLNKRYSLPIALGEDKEELIEFLKNKNIKKA